MDSKTFLAFDYDREDALLEFRGINSDRTRMADTKFEDLEDNE